MLTELADDSWKVRVVEHANFRIDDRSIDKRKARRKLEVNSGSKFSDLHVINHEELKVDARVMDE